MAYINISFIHKDVNSRLYWFLQVSRQIALDSTDCHIFHFPQGILEILLLIKFLLLFRSSLRVLRTWLNRASNFHAYIPSSYQKERKLLRAKIASRDVNVDWIGEKPEKSE